MPMIPEVVVAMLACARIGAPHNVVFGGFSPSRSGSGWSSPRPRRWSPSTAPAARARPRRSRRQVDEVMGDVASIETIFVVAPHRHRLRDERGPRRLVRRGDGGRRRRVPAGAARRRAPALHPLHVGLDREAEGHPAHDRRLPDRRRLDAPATSSTSSPRRTSTGARPTSAGSPATPTSSTGRWPTARPR